jgi:hypothetical protein
MSTPAAFHELFGRAAAADASTAHSLAIATQNINRHDALFTATTCNAALVAEASTRATKARTAADAARTAANKARTAADEDRTAAAEARASAAEARAFYAENCAVSADKYYKYYRKIDDAYCQKLQACVDADKYYQQIFAGVLCCLQASAATKARAIAAEDRAVAEKRYVADWCAEALADAEERAVAEKRIAKARAVAEERAADWHAKAYANWCASALAA